MRWPAARDRAALGKAQHDSASFHPANRWRSCKSSHAQWRQSCPGPTCLAACPPVAAVPETRAPTGTASPVPCHHPDIKTLMTWGSTDVVLLLHAHQQRPVTSQLINAGQLLLVILLQTAGKRLWPFPLCSAQTNALPYKHFHNTGRKRCIFLTGRTNLIRARYLLKTLRWPREQSRVHWKWQRPPPGDAEDRQSRPAGRGRRLGAGIMPLLSQQTWLQVVPGHSFATE